MSNIEQINSQFTPESDATDYFEGLTPGTGIPIFKGVETPAYGAAWSPEYQERWKDWYYRNGSIQNGMFVARGATPAMYQPHIAAGAYDPQVATQAAQQYLADNPKPIWEKTPDFAPRDTAAANARTGIEQAFRDYGISDLSPYSKDIEDRIAKTIAGIPTGTTDYETYFKNLNLGPSLISELEGPYRNTARGAFDKAIQTDYFADTSDDPYIASMLAEDRKAADEYINNMLARGQIIGTGAEAARKELDRQAGLGSTRLNEIGANLLNTQEGVLGTERGKRRSAFDTLKLGQPYDVSADDAALDKMASDFLGTLNTGLRTGLGGTPLFATSGLGAIAGTAQGGQNTTFGGTGGAAAGGATTTAPKPPKEEDEPLQQDFLF
jgi:hypothetical protein